MQSLTLSGAITGRSHANGPVDVLGNPVEHTHDRNVTLTVSVYPPGGHASTLVVWLDSLERGSLEIGDAVTVTVAPDTRYVDALPSEQDTGTAVVEP